MRKDEDFVGLKSGAVFFVVKGITKLCKGSKGVVSAKNLDNTAICPHALIEFVKKFVYRTFHMLFILSNYLQQLNIFLTK